MIQSVSSAQKDIQHKWSAVVASHEIETTRCLTNSATRGPRVPVVIEILLLVPNLVQRLWMFQTFSFLAPWFSGTVLEQHSRVGPHILVKLEALGAFYMIYIV